jgi:hypothetical protein
VTHSLASASRSPTKPHRHRLSTFQGILAAFSFSLLLAGTNANTPLIPLYRELLGFTPLTMSLTFVCYVSVLIVFLTALSRPSIVRWSPILLSAGLAMAVLSDIAMATATEAGVLLGRALAGVGVGLGTGSAAALVVAAFGASGRAVSATGNLVGAVVGTLFSEVVVLFLGKTVAISWAFEAHAVTCFILFVLMSVTFVLMRDVNRSAFSHVKGTASDVGPALARNIFPLVIGSTGWIAISLAITFFPSFLEEGGMEAIKSMGMIVLLTSCALSQVFGRRIAAFAPSLSGVEAMAIGVLLILLGSSISSEIVGFLGFGLLGAGIGVSYRLALIMLTKGVSPRDHGALSSTYAGITYAAAAFSVAATGFAGNLFGLKATITVVLVMLTLAFLAIVRKAPRLRMDS